MTASRCNRHHSLGGPGCTGSVAGRDVEVVGGIVVVVDMAV